MQQALFLFADVIVEWNKSVYVNQTTRFPTRMMQKNTVPTLFFTDACGGVKEKMCYIRTEIEKLAEWRRD